MSYSQMTGSPTRRRIPALVAAVAALVAGLFAVVVPSSAALAGPGDRIVYCEEHRLPDGRLIIPCWVLDDVWVDLRPDPDPCLTCPFAVQFKWSIDPGDFVVSKVADGMFDGLHSLLAASVEVDPQKQKIYREQAWASYQAAASDLGQARLDVGNIWMKYEKGMGDPTPQPNMELFAQYGNDVLKGLELLQSALADPKNASYYEQLAHDSFDSGAAAFANAIADL